jgi:hypothetical protein
MLIGLLLLSIVLGTNDDSPFLNPEMEKVLKEVIVDADRKKEVLSMTKAYKAEWKAFNKQRMKYVKEGKALNRDRSVNKKELENLFAQARGQRREVHQTAIELRLKLQKDLSEEEWSAGIDKILTIDPKKEKKLTKAEAKKKLTQDKLFINFNKKLESILTDPAELNQAQVALNNYENELASWIVDYQSFTYKEIDVLRKQGASREELENAVNQFNIYWEKAHQSFFDFREELLEVGTEENWPKLAKAMEKFY